MIVAPARRGRRAAPRARRAAPRLDRRPADDVFVANNEAAFTGGAFVHVPRDAVARGPDRAHRDPGRDAARALNWRAARRPRGGRAGGGLGAVRSPPATDAAGLFNTIVELVVGAEREPALRLRPEPLGDVVDLRHPARRGPARRHARLGRARLRRRRRGQVRMETKLAGPGAVGEGHRRLRRPRPPAPRLRHHPGARRRPTRSPTSPSAGCCNEPLDARSGAA